MDFLQILTIYVFGFVTCVGLYFFRDIPLLKYGPLGYIRHVCWKTYMHVVPQSLLDLTYNVIHTALYTRNQAFRLIFGSILFLGHVVFVIDMLPILYRFRPDENHVLFPIVNLLATLYVYHRSCVDDPGEITPVTLHKYSNVYSYDNRLYSPRNMCRTCQFYKPARSKHCSICDRCVHRFDHHCIWTNSDIGGLNHRFFVLFLWSLLCIQFDGVIVGTRCLWLHSTHYKLMDASVMMSSGEVMPVTKFIVFQHLFMHFPRLVFLIVSLGLIIPMVGNFCVYHTYLILFNQTTNERYKEAEVQAAHKHSCSTIDKPNKGRQFKLHKNEADNSHSLSYNNGFIQNIKEVFCVHTFLQHKRKLR